MMEDNEDNIVSSQIAYHYGNEVVLLGYASGIAANNSDCGLGPMYLYQHAELFKNCQVRTRWGKILQHNFKKSQDKLKAIIKLNKELAQWTQYYAQIRQKFCALAGDHASAIGTWSGVANAYRKQGDIGLIWIDAHMDSHTPETSESGNIHGMPISHLLGYGIPGLKYILDENPKLKPANICLIGTRSYETGEKKFLEKLNVKIFFMQDIEKLGLDKVFKQALMHVSNHTCGYGITLDLDAIDPTDAPGVGCLEKGGLNAKELIVTLRTNKSDHPLIGLEIAEYNPLLDQQQRTAQLIPQFIDAIYYKG